jgi:hypothetical protein
MAPLTPQQSCCPALAAGHLKNGVTTTMTKFITKIVASSLAIAGVIYAINRHEAEARIDSYVQQVIQETNKNPELGDDFVQVYVLLIRCDTTVPPKVEKFLVKYSAARGQAFRDAVKKKLSETKNLETPLAIGLMNLTVCPMAEKGVAKIAARLDE